MPTGVTEQFGKMLTVSLGAAFEQLAVFGDNADLTGDFAEIETDEVPSGSPSYRGLGPQNVRSSMPPARWPSAASSNLF